MKRKKIISICIPCYNEEKNVENAYYQISKIVKRLTKYDFEIILVDNGSTDKTPKLMKKIAKKDPRLVCIFLTRNFGPEASGQAGLDYCHGDAYIGIAADLQDPPELIPKFIEEWQIGNRIVLGTYEKPVDSISMSMIRNLFYKIFQRLSKIDLPRNTTGFGLLDRKVIDALKQLPENYRFHRGLLIWVGYKKSYISYKRQRRTSGKSSYSLLDYLHFAERGLFGFSYLPLDIMVYSGLFLVLMSFIFILGYLIVVIYYGNPINASIPILLSIVFFGGITLLAISIIGKYIQVIVEETKARPIYIIDAIIKKNDIE